MLTKVKNGFLGLVELSKYLLVGLMLLGVEIPLPHPDMLLDAVFKQEFYTNFYWLNSIHIIQAFFGLLFILAGLGSYYAKCVLYQFDVQIASIIYSGRFRSISGHLGYRRFKNPNSLRWKVATKVVDTIFFFDHNHCDNAYRWEVIKGFWENI